ncbi:dTDP-4-dehydrorhamnose reductase [Clostridium magnum]|uniref:dTDP-4-dehydrorhamnose reductase n=1 Tax=Clostridium magnum DSM 2767 TaxID=1121326 RepID=A0A162UAF2_9CLOT|nr:dTDP-4-dehydrorhamnose reductase [Clostridium magnum]KZL93701.1 dTDP-4-dehydrorhamnose reductase [Clostridium magnum DSM 2767]SHI10078.1 dTDP-4-dehydrorhamnose reductase [Clostridium magnum DSM 2767]
MKILITGCKGQLGSEIIHILQNGTCELETIPQEYKYAKIIGTDSKKLDITNLGLVREYMDKVRPNIVINSAAYTNVDGCESNQNLAFKVNSLGARNLAIACEQIDAKFIHISTDYVFEGNGTIPYREYDIANPVSVYGKTKLLGENYVREFCSKYFIVRTAWLYGHNGNNFVKTIIKAAKEKGHLDVVDDQRGNPTNAEDLAFHILKLALTYEYGIYHCTGTGECTWYDFANTIVQYTNIDCTINPITSDKINRVAKRPAFSSLDNMMLRCTVGDKMRAWEQALKGFISEFLKE